MKKVIYVCDRCGEESKEKLFAVAGIKADIDFQHVNMDLCDACYRGVLKFLYKKDAEGRNEAWNDRHERAGI